MTGAPELLVTSAPRARTATAIRTLFVAACAGLLAACVAQPQFPIGAGEAPGQGLQPLAPSYPVRDAPGAMSAAGTPSPSQPPAGAPPAVDDDAPVASTAFPRSAAGTVEQTPLPPASAAAPQSPGAPYAAFATPTAPPATRRLVHKPGTLVYVVARHDTLWGVGHRFGVAPAALARANGLDPESTLRPGTRLKLPADARDAGGGAHASGAAERTPGRTIEVVASAPRRHDRPGAIVSPPLRDVAVATPSAVPPPAAASPPTPMASRFVDRAESGPAAPIPYSQLGRRSRGRGRRSERLASTEASPPITGAAPAALPVEAPAPDAQAVADAARGRFIRPVAGALVSGFGIKGPGQRNDGVDLAAREGESVRAAAAGVIVYAGHDVPALGNLVAVKHSDGWVTVYGNLETITVRPTEHVGQGDQIGRAGATTTTPRAQVHFEVRYAADPSDKARPVDPTLVLPKAG